MDHGSVEVMFEQASSMDALPLGLETYEVVANLLQLTDETAGAPTYGNLAIDEHAWPRRLGDRTASCDVR